jgi:hypothetical protein
MAAVCPCRPATSASRCRGQVKGGFYGTHPSLADFDAGNLKMTTNFRRVYATAIKDWLGVGSYSPRSALAGSTRAAVSAGTMLARPATSRRMATAAVYAIGSTPLTP